MKQFQINKLSTYIFYLFLFFLPQQFGPHFWPLFSYVRGIRVDYLSPTLYISDFLILLLFLFSFKQVFSNKQVRSFLFSKVFMLFLIVLCIPLLYCNSPTALFYGLFLFFKFLYLGLFTASMVKKHDVVPIACIFLIGGLLESFLAIFQSLKQSSLGGFFYFFGERAISASSIGAAVISTVQGIILRPYGTFSHPNVLAFFLFTAFTFGMYMLKATKNNFKKILILAAITVMQIGILLSFSRTVLFLDFIFLALFALRYGSVKNFRNKWKITVLVLALLTSFLVFFSNRVSNIFSLSSAITPRLELTGISIEIIKQHPLFGVGLNNFFFHEVEFQKNFSSVYLQPVHNIYLFIAAQAGIIGLGIVFLFLYRTAKNAYVNLKNNPRSSFLVPSLLFSLLFVGLLDHYPITIQQGQLLTAFILGLTWNKELSRT